MHAGCDAAASNPPVWIPGLRCASPGMTSGAGETPALPAKRVGKSSHPLR
jgi:hypothetical protein